MLVIEPMKLFNDNKSTINVIHNTVQHDRMKPVRIDKNFIKIEKKNGTIVLSYTFIPSLKKLMF